jgi:hypothetical protein
MGPVGFEPTTASAPGQYLNEMNYIKSTEMVSLTKLDDGPLRLTQRECFLNVVLLYYQKIIWIRIINSVQSPVDVKF